MRWKHGKQSANIEDRRGSSVGSVAKLSGAGAIIAIILTLLFGGDPTELLNQMKMSDDSASSSRQPHSAKDNEMATFVSVVLKDTEEVWHPLFRAIRKSYKEPKLVLFSDSIDSACGLSSAAMGPFYCPADQKVYIDLTFFKALEQMGATGEFARAYVIGHEIGHHVQNLLGISSQVSQLQNRSSQKQSNTLSVLLELQADCYAGVWGHHTSRNENNIILESGDVESGINAAKTIGDDQLQRSAGRRVNPDAFTHGSSKQRADWFKTGLKYGKMEKCNTFK